jgi:hypothetical protein
MPISRGPAVPALASEVGPSCCRRQENRRFTMVSNIMETKHDTAKNAINNIR